MEFSSDTDIHNPANRYSAEIMTMLLQDLQQSVEQMANRFLGSMPAAWFQDTDPQTQLRHIKSLIASDASGESQVLSLRNQQGTEFTFISDRSYPGQLGKFIRQLPKDKPLLSARVYTALDGKRVLDVFNFGKPAGYDPASALEREMVALLLDKAAEFEQGIDIPALRRHLESCNKDYLHMTPIDQVVRQFHAAQQVRHTGNVLVDLSKHHAPAQCRLTFGISGADNRMLFERITAFLGKQKIDIQRAYLDSFDGAAPVSILSFLVQYQGEAFTADSEIWRSICADLKRLVYLDEEVYELAGNLGGCDLQDAEILLGLGRLAHQRLVKQDALLFSRERIHETLSRQRELSLLLAGLFRHRFTPGEAADTASLRERIQNEVESPTGQTILLTLLMAVDATLRTNLWLENRFALALRIDPEFLCTKGREELPYGVFFVSGQAFDGFHVRFRDIARGGVRIVRPAGHEQYALESERHYDECYGLAAAQQLKNKDIPEGGSKGVILAKPAADFEQVGHAYADALLDLIVPGAELFERHNDFLKHDELLYLGPDENVSNDLIEWIISRARLRGHPMPDAFMSSKPGAGINHKQYGVTSEGVTVFLESALREAGIEPREQAFTVKITGGPDGDVAGNEILILDREYGDKVRILGIADGSGSLEDPQGLDMVELRRLVTEALPVSEFDRGKLSDFGTLVTVHEAGGIQRRNTMHNRIIADAFIPAGGRPRTINSKNWRAYLSDDGKPSSKVIVEGANLFITPAARELLGKEGVLIIKDSSANKCGVICSSYEIVSSMLLKEDEFLRIKEVYVAQVLEKLRQLAAIEAQSLLDEHKRRPHTDLPGLSIVLSRVINRAADLLAAAMDDLRAANPELTRALVERHLPAVLLETCGERIFEGIPAVYLNRIMASRLASRIVYREGLGWFENHSDEAVIELASRYLSEEARIEGLITRISQSEMAGKNEIIELLKKGGVAAAMRD